MKLDGRRVTHDAAAVLRKIAVSRVLEGESPSKVMASLGLSRTVIYRWLKRWHTEGEESFEAKPIPGRPALLSDRQCEKVRTWLDGSDPRDFGFQQALWSRSVVANLINQRFHVALSPQAVGALLHRLGITPHQPLQRAYRRKDSEVDRWKRETYPRLKRQASRERAEIFFWDEAGARSNEPSGSTWGKRGSRVEVRVLGKRQSVNAASAINERGAFWYRLYHGKLTGEKFVALLKEFMKRRRRPVLLVVDNLKIHRSDPVEEYIQEQKGRLELHFLPSYAPDLNPDEFVWHQTKAQRRKVPLMDGECIDDAEERRLEAIKTRPALVRSFFNAPSVAYVRESRHRRKR